MYAFLSVWVNITYEHHDVTAMIMFITCMYVQWNPSKAGSQCDTGAMSVVGVVGKEYFSKF